MPTVTVSQPSTIKVQVNTNQAATVQNITYGARSILNSTDLVLENPQDGAIITYDSANNDFVLAPVNANSIPIIDGGLF